MDLRGVHLSHGGEKAETEQRAETQIEVTGVPITAVTSV